MKEAPAAQATTLLKRIEDVLRRALEAQDAEETWTDEERRALSAHIEEGYLQAERGELTDGARSAVILRR
jgi:hypothetical protein